MGGFADLRGIELNQPEVSPSIDPPVQQKVVKLGFHPLAQLLALLTLIVGIFVGFGFLIYLCIRVPAELNNTNECNFTRPSEILNHLLKVNDHLLAGLTAIEACEPSRYQITLIEKTLMQFTIVNRTLNEIRKSIAPLEKIQNAGGLKGVGTHFDFTSALTSLVNLTATIANEQIEVDWYGIVETSEGHVFLKESQFTKEAFFDTEFCEVSQDNLNKLHLQFGIEFLNELPEKEVCRSFKKEDLLNANNILKQFRMLLRNREARFDELVKAFDIHKPKGLSMITRDETLNRVKLEDGPPIPYYHGNSSFVDQLRKATGNIRRAVSVELKTKYELTILAQRQITEDLKESFAFVKATLRNRRRVIEELLQNVKREGEDLYLKVLLLAEAAGSHRIVFL